MITGAYSAYGRQMVVTWWLLHTSVSAFGIFWPLKYRQLKNMGHLKYFHVSFIAVGIILPLPLTLAQIWMGGYGFDVVKNYRCVPIEGVSANPAPLVLAALISLVLHLFIAAKIYILVSTIIVMCVSVCDPFFLQRSKSLAKENEYLVEIKLTVIIFASFMIFFLLAGIDILIIWGSNSIKTSMQALFNCEARGKVDGFNCSRDSSFHSLFTILDTINGILRSNFQVLYIIFLVDFKSAKTKALKLVSQICTQNVTHSN